MEEILNNLNDEQRKKVNEFKSLPKPKGGRPPKEYGKLLMIAARVLKDAGMTKADIAKELKVNVKSVTNMLRDAPRAVDIKDLNKVREEFSAHIAGIINKMLMAANTDEYIYNLQSTKNQGLVIALATLIDKMNLLTGKPTAILETKDLAESVQKQMREIEELERALKEPIINPPSAQSN